MRDLYTNPYKSILNKYFEIFGLTNWIRDTNLLKKGIQIESTIQILWNQVYETNPRYKSFECRMDSRIRSTGFKWICTCSKYAYVLRFVKICWIRENRLNLLKIGWIPMYDTIQVFPCLDSWSTIRDESMDLQNESMFLRISHTIPAPLLFTPFSF